MIFPLLADNLRNYESYSLLELLWFELINILQVFLYFESAYLGFFSYR